MVIDILVASSCGVAGLICGWLLYPAFNNGSARDERDERELAARAKIAAETELARTDEAKAEKWCVASVPEEQQLQQAFPKMESIPAPQTSSLVPFEKAAVPRALQGLPRGTEVAAEFGVLAKVPTAPGTTFITAVVRFDRPARRVTTSIVNALQPGDLYPMVQLARTVRGVLGPQDRIGLLDPETLVIVMPQIDHESAILRADRIRSIFCFEELESEEPGEDNSVSVSLTCSSLHTGFDSMLKIALANLKRSMASSDNKTVEDWSEIFSIWH